ncbi:MAG: AraC family transcriptional regulator [Ardenticatenaceae bacterium]|nr:AraC family transcriptional regulator [Ardenticatenaceae bacterium]
MAVRVNDTQQNIYIQRVNGVLDYITTHPVDELSLKTLAGVAGFSEFHFHRIFKAVVGETLNQFVWRVRIERGANLLRANPDMQISDAAAACGFTSLAGFSRAFKTRFGRSPARWDRQTRLQNEPAAETPPVYQVTELQSCSQEFAVTFREMPAQRLAYIRVHDAYSDANRIEDAYCRLLDWFTARGGNLKDTTLFGMSQDDPDITPVELCRFDWCLRVPDFWQGDEAVTIRDFPACLLATIEMDGHDIQMEDRIWKYFWRAWLPHSQYQPRNLPAMEIYRRFPHEVADQTGGWWDKFYMDCAVPVERL